MIATTHFARTVYKGRSGDGMARQRVQYITRTGAYSPAEARIRHQGLEAGSDEPREDLVYWRARNLPAWAEAEPIHFFAAAEQHTSAHQTAYEEWKVSLPRELARRQQMDAARDFVQVAFGDRHPVCWAFHDPLAADGGRQPHLHILWSSRTLDGIDRPAQQFFRRYNRAHPERGGAEKAREFSHFGAVKASRVLYTDIMNAHLERAGHAARLHPDKLSDRGFDRAPEPRAQPSDSNAAKYTHAITETWQHVLDHRGARALHAPAELANAQAYWQQRKQALGITRDMALTEHVAHIRATREEAMNDIPDRTPTRALAQRLERSVRDLEAYVDTVQQYARREARCEARLDPRAWEDELQAERVLAAGKEHGLPRDPTAEQAVEQMARWLAAQERAQEQGRGQGLNVRLYRKKDRGMGW